MKKEGKMDFANKLFETAVQDYNSSILLYNQKIYHNSIYFLQQCVEKLSKAFAVRFDQIQPNQLKTISHQGYKTMISPAKNALKEIDTFKKTFITTQEFEILLAKSSEEVTNFIDLLDKITNAGLDELQTIDQIEEILAKIEGPESTEEHNFHTVVDEHTKELREFTKTIAFKDSERPNEALSEEISDEYLKQYSQALAIVMPLQQGLLWLNLLLTPHQNRTRYPLGPALVSPMEMYTLETPIIKTFESLSGQVHKTLNLYILFLEYMKQTNSEG